MNTDFILTTPDEAFFKVPQSMKEEYAIKKFCLDWSDKPINKFVADLFDKGLTRHDITMVIKVLERTCHRCFDAPTGCRCRDEH